MNIDKPLEELIADKRAPAAARGGGGAATRGRVSRDTRAAAVPYARPAPRPTGAKWAHDAYSGPGAGPRRGGAVGPARLHGAGAVGGHIGFTGVSPRLHIAGLHYEVAPSDLTNIFSQIGPMQQTPQIVYDRSGRSTGEAFVEYSTVQEAKAAINKFDGAMTKGQTISIKFSPPVHRPAPASAGSFGPGSGARAPVGRPQTGAALLARMGGGAPAAAAAAVPRGGFAAGRGRGGPARGRGGAARGGGNAKAGPPDAGNLDKELDAFMKTDASGDVAMA